MILFDNWTILILIHLVSSEHLFGESRVAFLFREQIRQSDNGRSSARKERSLQTTPCCFVFSWAACHELKSCDSWSGLFFFLLFKLGLTWVFPRFSSLHQSGHTPSPSSAANHSPVCTTTSPLPYILDTAIFQDKRTGFFYSLSLLGLGCATGCNRDNHVHGALISSVLERCIILSPLLPISIAQLMVPSFLIHLSGGEDELRVAIAHPVSFHVLEHDAVNFTPLSFLSLESLCGRGHHQDSP